MFVLTMADGRKGEGLSVECGLSGQVCCVGQEACWRRVVCRDKYGEWVKGIGDGVWSVGSSLLRGSRELSAACGLSGQVWRVGQEACRRVWSVGSSMASGSRELLAECGLSGQVWRVSQEACRWVWSVGAKMLRGSKGLSLECGLSARKCCVGQRDCR